MTIVYLNMKLNPTEYLSKKIYFLHLNSDSTYVQYIQLILMMKTNLKCNLIYFNSNVHETKIGSKNMIENEIDMKYIFHL